MNGCGVHYGLVVALHTIKPSEMKTFKKIFLVLIPCLYLSSCYVGVEDEHHGHGDGDRYHHDEHHDHDEHRGHDERRD